MKSGFYTAVPVTPNGNKTYAVNGRAILRVDGQGRIFAPGTYFTFAVSDFADYQYEADSFDDSTTESAQN